MAKQRTASKGAAGAHGQRGLIIFGSDAGAGKTVVMSALSKLLSENGFENAAIKPVGIGNASAFAAEQGFIADISGYTRPYNSICLPAPGDMTQNQWTEAVTACTTTGVFTLVELPGCPATPLSWPDGERLFWKDTGDLATQLGWPCVLVSRLGERTIEQCLLNCIYLKRRNIEVLGLITVCPTPEHAKIASKARPFPDGFETVIGERLRVPYLGAIPFAPALSVLGRQRGNLLKLAETNLDILPLLKRLNLPTPMGTCAGATSCVALF